MVLDKTGKIEETGTPGTQEEPYPGIDAESWTFCHDDTFIDPYPTLDTEEGEVIDSNGEESGQKEIEAQALRCRAIDIVDGKQAMPAKDAYKTTRTTQEQGSLVQLWDYVREERRSRERLRIEQTKDLKKRVEELEEIAAEARRAIREPTKPQGLLLEKPYEVLIRMPPGGQQTVHSGYIPPHGGYVPPGFYTKVQQLQTELMKYDPRYHPERRVEKWTTPYYQLW